MPERRWQHQDEIIAAGLSAPDETVMHHLWQIVDEGVLGASRHVALSNDLLLHLLQTVSDPHEAFRRASMAAGFIARSRGQDTPVIGNSLALLLEGLVDVPPEERVDMLRKRIERCGEAAARRKADLVAAAVNRLADKRQVLAFDYSSTVTAIVIACAAQQPDLSIVVPESRAIAGGARYLEAFLTAGLAVRYLPDAAIEYALRGCDAVLLGVETLRLDGSFLNTIGSRMIATLAKPLGVELFGCTDLLKVDQRGAAAPEPALRSYDDGLLAGLDLVGLERVDTRAPELEVVPANLVTAILTEHGPVAPADIQSLASLR